MLPRRCLVVGMLCLTLPAAAQDTPRVPKLTESIEVSIVNLDVFVTDKKGIRILGLTSNDFEILEDGKRQSITNFAEYSSQAGEGARHHTTTAATVAGEPAAKRARTVILFVDRFHLSKMRADPFFASVRATLHHTVRPGDSLMIATWYRGLLRIRHQFSDDIAGLDQTIDSIAAETTAASVDEFRQARDEADDALEFEREAAAMAASHGGNFGDTSFSAVMGAYGRAKMAQAEQKRKIDSLKAMMRAVSEGEGKKILILATHRLSSIAGAEFLYAAGASIMEVMRYSDLLADLDLRSLTQTANANGVAVYSMYPEGLVTDDGLDPSRALYPYNSPIAAVADPQIAQYNILENETLSLGEISEQTGGISDWGPKSAKLLADMEEDLENYYSLAYHARGGNFDRPRNVVVKTKDRALVVRSRRNVVAKSEVTRMEDHVISALFRVPESPSFSMSVDVGTPRVDRKKLIVPIVVHIPIAALTTLPDGNSFAGAFSVYTAWGSKFQRVSETSHDTKQFRIPANDITKARQSYYTYEFEVASDGRADRLSVGVLDELSKEYALRVVELPNRQTVSR